MDIKNKQLRSLHARFRLILHGVVGTAVLACSLGTAPAADEKAAEASVSVERTGTIHLLSIGCGVTDYQGPESKLIFMDEKNFEMITLDDNAIDIGKIKLGSRVTVKGAYKSAAAPGGSSVLTVSQIENTAGTVESTRAVTASAAPTTTTLRCLLLFANTKDYTVKASTVTTVKNVMFNNPENLAASMRQATYGHYTLSFGATYTATLNVTAQGYDSGSMVSNMLSAASAAGYKTGNYDRTLVFVPAGTSMPAPAYAYMPGTLSVYSYGVTESGMNMMLHELGHNFGLRHSSNKGGGEYSDETCVMGGSKGGMTTSKTYSALKKYLANWTAPYPGSVTAATQDATYDLYPYGKSPDSVPGLRVVQIGNTEFYTAYGKNDTPYEQIPGFTRAVTVTRNVIDRNSVRFAAMTTVGNTFTDSLALNAKVTVEYFGPNNDYATVSFDFPDNNTKPVANAQTVTLLQNTSKSITLTGSDADGDNLVISTVSAPSNGTLTGTGVTRTYTPTPGFTGYDSFVFKVFDGKIASYATVNINVISATPPTVTWTVSSQIISNETGSATVTAQLSAMYSQPITVPILLSGTATVGADYAISANQLIIPAYTAGASVTITVLDDLLDEVNETAVLTMGTPTNAVTGTLFKHTVTIKDNDPTPTVAWTTPSQYSLNEVANSTMTVTAKLSTVSGRQVKVPFTLTGTATKGSDYQITSSPIIIPAGATTGTATITILGDTTAEGNETIILTMGTVSGATKGAITQHTATITDDDVAMLSEIADTSKQSNAESNNSSCGLGSGLATLSLFSLTAWAQLRRRRKDD